MTLIGKLFLSGRSQTRGRIVVISVLALSFTSFNCQKGANANRLANANLSSEKSAGTESVPTYGYEIVNTWPHDSDGVYTRLVFHDGKLLESTGQVGQVEPPKCGT